MVIIQNVFTLYYIEQYNDSPCCKLRANASSILPPLIFVTQIKRVEPQRLFFPPRFQVPEVPLPPLYRKTFVC